MPRRKKPAHEMTDAELLRQVFPEGVSQAIEREVQEVESEPDIPDADKDK